MTKADAGHRVIRAHASMVARKMPNACRRCGYDLFVEVAHIKAVKDFPDSSKVEEINDISNLVKLCPNCHHEFDAGLFRIEEIEECRLRESADR
jgi:predicted restriction endonuclease